MKNPKAFISHSSDDKERFVVDFATRLQANGVEVWLDQWEMYPGDSLIDKIFNEGLAEADIFIIVVSKNSIDSKWVREELNAGTIKRINGQCKVIPILIDSVDVPTPLLTTLYRKIEDLNDYDEDFRKILYGIFGTSDKPALGPLPAFAIPQLNLPQGLTKLDFFWLDNLFQAHLEHPYHMFETKDILDKALEEGYSQHDATESLNAMCEDGYLEGRSTFDRNNYPKAAKTTLKGNSLMYRQSRSDFAESAQLIVSTLINHPELPTHHKISTKCDLSKDFVTHVLMELESKGYIKIQSYLGPIHYVLNVSSALKRAFEADINVLG